MLFRRLKQAGRLLFRMRQALMHMTFSPLKSLGMYLIERDEAEVQRTANEICGGAVPSHEVCQQKWSS